MDKIILLFILLILIIWLWIETIIVCHRAIKEINQAYIEVKESKKELYKLLNNNEL